MASSINIRIIPSKCHILSYTAACGNERTSYAVYPHAEGIISFKLPSVPTKNASNKRILDRRNLRKQYLGTLSFLHRFRDCTNGSLHSLPKMRHLSRALVQSLGWLQNAKEVSTYRYYGIYSDPVVVRHAKVNSCICFHRPVALEDSSIRRLFLTTEEDGDKDRLLEENGLMMSPGLMDMDDDALPQFMMGVGECGLDVNQMATSMFAMVGQLGAAGEEDGEIGFPVLDPN
eukprot:scaffold66816_cov52-Attheya_sp.AAC.1